MKISPLAPR